MSNNTFEFGETTGVDTSWRTNVQDQLSQMGAQLGDNAPSVNALRELFNKAKEFEIESYSRAQELLNIKKDSEKSIDNLNNETKEFKEKINNELGLWRYFIIGALIVIGVSFVTLTIDTFWKRDDKFDKINSAYTEKINSLENNFNTSKTEFNNSNNILKSDLDNTKKCIQNFGVTSKCFK